MNPDAALQLEKIIGSLSDQFKSLTQQIGNLSTSLQGLVTSGLAATAEGNKLSYAWLLLSRQIAAIFIPAINWLIEKILAITQWFRNLTGDSQFLIMKLSLVVVAVVAVATIASILVAVLSPLTLAIGMIVPALIYFFTETELGKSIIEKVGAAISWMVDNWYMLINVFELITGALTKVVQVIVYGFALIGQTIIGWIIKVMEWIPGLKDTAASLKKIKEGDDDKLAQFKQRIDAPIQLTQKPEKGKSDKPRQDVSPTGFSFESLSASFERITAEANKKDLALEIAKQQLEEQKKIAEGVKGGVKAAPVPPPKGDL